MLNKLWLECINNLYFKMNSTTLRGVFPEPKTVCKRNFIKENVQHIKEMQGVVQNSESEGTKPVKATSKYEVGNKSQYVLKPSSSLSHTVPNHKMQKSHKKKFVEIAKPEPLNIRPHLPFMESINKYSHRAVQTDKPEEIQKLYKNGNIKFPSPGVVKTIMSKRSPKKKDNSIGELDRGDADRSYNHEDELSSNLQSLDVNEKHDFIKENILALKQKSQKQDAYENTKTSNYQKGVLPKYLRDRKEEQQRELEDDPECPKGHVLLPDEERKETLRVLRQSYADRIQELNSMPVRNDTLKMQKRKMAIEEELKKIDEGIKVFQRPKVFVKINA